MSFSPVGDLARHLMIRRQTSLVKSDVNRLAQMLGNGRKSDVPASLRGNLGPLNGVENTLSRLTGWSFAASGLTTRMEAMQIAMAAMRTIGEDAAKGFIVARQPDQIDLVAKGSVDTLQSLLGQLNTRIGETSLFSGVESDSQAVGSAEDLLSALLPEVIGLTTPEAVADRVLAWMQEPTGFAAVSYLGGDGAPPISVSAQDRIALDITAKDPGFAKLLSAAALGALLDLDLFAGDIPARQKTVELTAELYLSSAQDTVNLAARLGQNQAELQQVTTRNTAERSALMIIRNDILRADPEETASDLAATSSQLELIFAMTARLSSLTLLNALR